jgi:CheY-like chemotaxis protein
MDEQLATKPTILLVDDEESILNSLRRLLRGQPFDVVLAGSGAQALDIMAAQPIDLVMSYWQRSIGCTPAPAASCSPVTPTCRRSSRRSTKGISTATSASPGMTKNCSWSCARPWNISAWSV